MGGAIRWRPVPHIKNADACHFGVKRERWRVLRVLAGIFPAGTESPQRGKMKKFLPFFVRSDSIWEKKYPLIPANTRPLFGCFPPFLKKNGCF